MRSNKGNEVERNEGKGADQGMISPRSKKENTTMEFVGEEHKLKRTVTPR